MLKIVFTFLVMLATLSITGQSPSFKTYTNPVIPGDHPDCTLTKVGKYFYTTGSSFNPTPKIYRSTNLVHWETIAQPVSASWTNYGDTPGGGCWGGHLVFYNGKFWHFFSRSNTMYFAKADKPEGPWATPVKINNPASIGYGLGYDNSIFIDDNNKWYLVVKNGQPNNGIVELSSEGQPTGLVYDLNWLNPAPVFQYSWAEGPVMWKYNGYYYYSFGINVAGGQKVMRSKTLTAEKSAWEIMGDFFNENDPQKSTSFFGGPNHASPAVLIHDSTSWVVHPVWAKTEWRGQGRQGLLNQVKYYATGKPTADYPVNKSFTAPNLSSSGIPWMVPKSDFFDSSVLNPEWSFLGYTTTNKYSLSERQGWLRLTAKSSIKANTLIKNDGEHNYTLITRVDFDSKSLTDEAGLMIMRGDEKSFVKLFSSRNSAGNKIIGFSFDNSKYETVNTIGDTLWLKIMRVNHRVSGLYSRNGINWAQVGNTVDISSIDSYSDFSSWAGTRQGLYVQGNTSAFFDLYIYRDAFTPILAECPANQLGTNRQLSSSGEYVLDNINNNDWALYAGVEFGTGQYYALADTIQFTVSSGSAGGFIEVWLDSIGTGTKIADCKIENTRSWNEFKKFKFPVKPVSGNRDLYLRFVGEGTSKLFQLKWILFSGKNSTVKTYDAIKTNYELKIFPNPAKNLLNINSGFRFHNIEIFDINGKKVLMRNTLDTNNLKLNFNLPVGLYILKVTGSETFSFSKFIVE